MPIQLASSHAVMGVTAATYPATVLQTCVPAPAAALPEDDETPVTAAAAAITGVRLGAREENRTPDLLITSELLYRLSYPGNTRARGA